MHVPNHPYKQSGNDCTNKKGLNVSTAGRKYNAWSNYISRISYFMSFDSAVRKLNAVHNIILSFELISK